MKKKLKPGLTKLFQASNRKGFSKIRVIAPINRLAVVQCGEVLRFDFNIPYISENFHVL